MTKKEQILKTALTLFIKNGFEKTPTSLIAKEAGVATGTLFHHFKTKEELINALYLDMKFQFRDTIYKGMDTDEPLKETIQLLWHNMISWVLENPEGYRFFVQFRESAYISASTRERAEAAFEDFTVLFEKGLEQGFFYSFPLDFLMNLLISHLFASCDYFLQHPELWEDHSFRAEVFASCWNSLAKAG